MSWAMDTLGPMGTGEAGTVVVGTPVVEIGTTRPLPPGIETSLSGVRPRPKLSDQSRTTPGRGRGAGVDVDRLQRPGAVDALIPSDLEERGPASPPPRPSAVALRHVHAEVRRRLARVADDTGRVVVEDRPELIVGGAVG